MPTHRQKLSSTEPKRRSPRRHGAKSVFPSSSSPNRSPVSTSNDNLKNRLVLGPSYLKTGLRSSFERRLSSGSDSGKENEVPGSMTQTLAVKDCGGSGCDDDRNKLSESDYANDGDGGRGDDSDDSRNSVQQKDESGEVLSPTISVQAINFKKHRSVEKGKKKYKRAAAFAGKLKLSFEDETAIDDDSDANSDGYSIKDDSNRNDIMNGNEEGEDGDSDSDDYDDESECSGDTVVAEDENLPNPPPPNATQEELNHYYWKLCYGADTAVERLTVEVGTWSAMRSAPAKSCLSTKKKPNCVGSSFSPSLTPRILHQSPTPNFEFSEAANLSTPDDSEESPPVNDLKNTLTINCANPRIQSAVKFGVNSAAEFDMEQPITEMTPIPITEVQRIFPSELIETEKDVEENELSRETARNTAILAEWDDDFDDIIAQDEDSDDELGIDDEDGRRSPKSHRSHGKKGTPFKPRGRGRRSSGSARRPQKNRRASQVFSRERRNLLDDDREDDYNSCLPLSVTIDPGEYSSPSVASTPSDISTITAATTAHHQGDASSNTTIDLPLMNPRESLDSTTSAFVSPNSPRSDANSLAGSDSCATNTTVTSGKETPKSARRSSSNVLREVHASGALLPINSPQGVSTGRLRPNHLKYSPRSSIESSESSKSTKSDSFGEIGCQPLSEDAFSIGNRLARILHIRVSDLANILEVTEEDEFIQDYICGKTNTAAALEMVVNGKRTESIFTGNSQWVQTAFFNYNNNADETGCARNRFESMLRDNIAEAFDTTQSAGSRGKNQLPLNGNVVTVHECLQDCLKSSCIEWSKIELAIANSASCELQASLKENESKASECKEAVRSGCSQLIEISRKAFKEMSTARVSISSKTVKKAKCRRKRKILSQITEESRTIRSMEGELALEVERLSRAKRAKTMFEDYLKLGSCLHIDRPFESVRIHWYDGLHVLLLDNNVDIIFILNDENDIIVKTNCFFNDHDGVTMKLLKTFLLGTSDGCHEGSPGGFPIRKSISSIFLARDSFREQLIEAFQLLFRIENFAKCIRLLNEVFVCCISRDGDKNVVLSVSAEPKEGEMIQINFSFENLLAENWNFTTVPSEVKVEVVSTKEEFHEREKRLTSVTKLMMASSIVSDPFLLKRVCDFVMEEI